MYYAYVIRSINNPEQYYFGYTTDLKRRLSQHNSSSVPHTSKYNPWKVVFYAAFATKELALAFEKYLKTASGKAFARKRLIK